jgi:hypothetical protein
MKAHGAVPLTGGESLAGGVAANAPFAARQIVRHRVGDRACPKEISP